MSLDIESDLWLRAAARPVPRRAAAISTGALAVPVAGQIFFPDGIAEYEPLLWLTALIPPFLYAYYRGWNGAAGALAVGMALLSTTQVVLIVLGIRIENWPLFLAVTMFILIVSVAIGWVSELLHRARERAEALAMIDDLTGLPNRRYANRVLQAEVAAAQRGRRLCVVFFDLDHFKAYNDRHGHVAGDQAIVAMARALNGNTRRMNLSSRWGGEEFLSILSESDASGATVFVNRVREFLANYGPPFEPVFFSAGVAEFGGGMASVEDLLEAADAALYRAKLAGRGCTVVFDRAQTDLPADPQTALSPT